MIGRPVALYDLHALRLRQRQLEIAEAAADKAKANAENDRWMELMSTAKRLRNEIKEMKRR